MAVAGCAGVAGFLGWDFGCCLGCSADVEGDDDFPHRVEAADVVFAVDLRHTGQADRARDG